MMTAHKPYNSRKTIISALYLALSIVISPLSGCQIGQQLIEIVLPPEDTNILEPNNIQPISTLSLTNQPAASRHSKGIILVRPLPTRRSVVISVGQEGTVLAWDLDQGKGFEVRKLPGEARVATLGESKGLIAWSSDKGVFVGCLFGCAQQKELPNFKVRPAALSFHDNDKSLLIGGTDGKIYRWRFFAEQEDSAMEDRDKNIERYMGHQTALTGIVGHTGGRVFFSSDWDGKLVGWLAYTADDYGGDFDKNVLRGRFYTDKSSNMIATRPLDRGISALALSSNGEQIALGTEDGYVEMWTVKGFFLAARQKIHEGRVISVAITDDGSRVASIGKDTKVKVSEPTPDPAFGVSPTALSKTLQEVSENTIPTARQVAFINAEKIVVGTSDGELAEIRIESLTPSAPPTTQHPQVAAPADSDY
jgi:WD40 repeat protein